MFYNFSKSVFVLILKIGFKFKVTGREHIPRKGGVILAANHTSYLDPAALGSAASRKVVFMARDTLFNSPLSSFWLRNVGVIPLKRHAGHLSSLRSALEIVNEGKVLGLFPEGTRSVNGKPGKPQAGVAFLAAQSGVPVVPVYISGTDGALPKNAKKIKLHKISVRFGKPIYINKEIPYQESADLIMANISKLAGATG